MFVLKSKKPPFLIWRQQVDLRDRVNSQDLYRYIFLRLKTVFRLILDKDNF